MSDERRRALYGVIFSAFSMLISLVAVVMAGHSIGWW